MSICDKDCLNCKFPDCILGKRTYLPEQQQLYHKRHTAKMQAQYAKEQRIITIARLRRGWKQEDLAWKLGCEQTDVSRYELGKVRAPWKRMYAIMPELEQMREKGCAAYCDSAHLCRLGACKYGKRGRPRKDR